MRIISWNLNGLTSCMNHGSFHAVAERDPDIVCCQEIRTKQQAEVLPGYHHYWNPAEREGYSGTLVMTKTAPQNITKGLGGFGADDEGRVLTLEYPAFFLTTAYAPNSQSCLERHQYRMDWDSAFRAYASSLLDEKPLIICGDFNVTLSPLDVYAENGGQSWVERGYATDERSNLEELLDIGLTDTFRALYPEERSYTWWSNRLRKRSQDRGWRLDYFFVSEELLPKIVDVRHHQMMTGSDHCPIELEVLL